jgi:ABC-type lipoprotein export system ATPase subunit
VLLAAVGLGHSFSGRPPLFRGLDFELVDGALTALTGPSGSGKSTLLSLLAGWRRPTEGTLVRDGVELVSWVPQSPFGVAQRSLLDHVALPLLARGWPRDRAEASGQAALSRFRLDAVVDSRYGEVSGGEAQRLMLARASLVHADLLVVDEPTAQLDPVSAAAVIETLGELADSGRIVVIATHDPRVAAVARHEIRLGT